MLKFTIDIHPVTKKNSMCIAMNKRTGRMFIKQNDRYLQYEKDAKWFMPNMNEPIDERVNVKAIFYVKDRRVRDLTNLNGALHDVLVKHKVLKDDKWEIVYSTDGSRVEVDKNHPRTEVEITKVVTPWQMP